MEAFKKIFLGAISQADRDYFTTHFRGRNGYVCYNKDAAELQEYLAATNTWVVLTLSGARIFPVQVRNMVSDVSGGGAPPVAVDHGDSYIVNNWGVGNYVGDYVGLFANGDVAVWDAVLAGFRRVLANVTAYPVNGIRVIVKPAGAVGSFAGRPNDVGRYYLTTHTWIFEDPADGWISWVIGEQHPDEGTAYIFDEFTVAGWYPIVTGVGHFVISNTWFVDQTGSDITGTGETDNPFASIGAAHAAAASGDEIWIGPGVYAETLTPTKRIHLHAVLFGSVTMLETVIGAAVLTISAVGCTDFSSDGIDFVNLSDTGPNDTAITINSNAGVKTVRIRGNQVIVGTLGANGTAFNIFGAGVIDAIIECKRIIGGVISSMSGVGSFVVFESSLFERGPTAWFTVIGTTGQIAIHASGMRGLNGTEGFIFGTGAAVGTEVEISASQIAAILRLNNVGGTARVRLYGGSSFARTIATALNQFVETINGRERQVDSFLIDANAAGNVVLFTAPAGRAFSAAEFYTINEVVATGVTFEYAVDGMAAGSVVAPVGPGSLALGLHKEVVAPELITAGNSLTFRKITPSGNVGDRVSVCAKCVIN